MAGRDQCPTFGRLSCWSIISEMKIVIAVWLLMGLASAKIDSNNYYLEASGQQRLPHAQPSIYAPDKALDWVDKYYKRSYAAQPYSFSYEVNDVDNNYGHQQESDGSVTTGSYRVLLPDGRTQIVNFRADKNGYVANVKYEVSIYKPSSTSSIYSKASPAVKKTAWTAFSKPSNNKKVASYKADLIAAFGGYKTIKKEVVVAPEIQSTYYYKSPVTTPSYVIAQPIDEGNNPNTTPIYYEASTTAAPTIYDRVVSDSRGWTAFKTETEAPIYEAKAVYEAIPEASSSSEALPSAVETTQDYNGVTSRRSIEYNKASITPEYSSQDDGRIKPFWTSITETTTIPPYETPSTQVYRDPVYETTTPASVSYNPSTLWTLFESRPSTSAPIYGTRQDWTAIQQPETTTVTSYNLPVQPWTAFRPLPSKRYEFDPSYVAPTTYKPAIPYRFPASNNNKASSTSSGLPAWTRPVAAAPASSNYGRLPSPLIFRTRNALKRSSSIF